MMRTIVTFGSNHYHPVSGLNLANHYVVVTGTDYEDCRRKTIEQFGTRWAFDYLNEHQAGVARFHLTEIDLITGEDVA